MAVLAPHRPAVGQRVFGAGATRTPRPRRTATTMVAATSPTRRARLAISQNILSPYLRTLSGAGIGVRGGRATCRWYSVASWILLAGCRKTQFVRAAPSASAGPPRHRTVHRNTATEVGRPAGPMRLSNCAAPHSKQPGIAFRNGTFAAKLQLRRAAMKSWHEVRQIGVRTLRPRRTKRSNFKAGLWAIDENPQHTRRAIHGEPSECNAPGSTSRSAAKVKFMVH